MVTLNFESLNFFFTLINGNAHIKNLTQTTLEHYWPNSVTFFYLFMNFS